MQIKDNTMTTTVFLFHAFSMFVCVCIFLRFQNLAFCRLLVLCKHFCDKEYGSTISNSVWRRIKSVYEQQQKKLVSWWLFMFIWNSVERVFIFASFFHFHKFIKESILLCCRRFSKKITMRTYFLIFSHIFTRKLFPRYFSTWHETRFSKLAFC